MFRQMMGRDIDEDKQHVMLKWSDCWSDEFDMEGYIILEEEQYFKWKRYFEDISDVIDMSFGTNESFYYDNGQALIDCTEVVYLTNIQLSVFNSLDLLCHGETCFYTYAEDDLEDYEEDDEPSDIDSFLF